jgi:hypothetical protein
MRIASSGKNPSDKE